MNLQDSGLLPAFTVELPPTVFRTKSMTTTPSRTAGSAIALEQVSKSFGARRVLGPIQLEMEHGEVISWIGAPGCGKTTLLRILAGLESPSTGTVRVGGSSPKEACIRQDIGIAFQRPALSSSRTALENVQMILEICNGRTGLNPQQLLTDFGLGERMDHYPHELSGDMLQRVNITCALVHQPRLLLLDEPFGALDEITRSTMSHWLAEVLFKFKQTAVLVTHSVEEAVTLSDRICIFSKDGFITQSEEVRLPRPRSRLRDEELYREITRIRQILHRVLRGETDK